jgi:hypothetical protein
LLVGTRYIVELERGKKLQGNERLGKVVVMRPVLLQLLHSRPRSGSGK